MLNDKSLSLDDLLRLAGEHAHRILIDMTMSDLMPSYLLINQRTNATKIVGCPWADDADKDLMIRRVRKEAKKLKATAFSHVSEAWMTDSREAADVLMVRPREHPRRREFVVAFAKDRDETRSRRWQIVRDKPGGQIIALMADEVEPGTFSGRLLEILP